MSKLDSCLLAFLIISNFMCGQGQPGEQGPPYYGLELPPYGSSREAFETFEKEVEKRKRAQSDYVPPPYENALGVINHGPSFHEGVIFSYDKESIEELKKLALDFEEKKHRFDRLSAVHALGIIHSVDPEAVDFQYLKNYAASIENNPSINQHDKVRVLTKAYTAISYSSNPAAFDFLTKRASAEFWGDEMPTTQITSTHGGHEDKPFIMSAQTQAIRQLAALKDPRLSAFLDKLASEIPAEQEEVHWAIQSARNSETRDKLRVLREAAYTKRLAAFGLKEEVGTSTVEASSGSDVDEAAEEMRESEPATEEPTEVKTADTTEKPAEQSSNGWLWLIGAALFVGGIGLAVRRKS